MVFHQGLVLLSSILITSLDAKNTGGDMTGKLGHKDQGAHNVTSGAAGPIKHFVSFSDNDLLCDRQHNTSVLVTKKDIVTRIREEVANGVVAQIALDAYKKFANVTASPCAEIKSKYPIPLFNTTAGPNQDFYVEWAWNKEASIATFCQAAAKDTAIASGKYSGIWPCHVVKDPIVGIEVKSVIDIPEALTCPRMLGQVDVETTKAQITHAILKGPITDIGRIVRGKCADKKYGRMGVYQVFVNNGAIQEIFAFDAQTGVAEHCEAVATDSETVPDPDDKQHFMEARCVPKVTAGKDKSGSSGTSGGQKGGHKRRHVHRQVQLTA